MKLNEELVIRLVDGSGYYIHMHVGDDNIVPNASHDLNSELSSDFEGTNRKMYTNVTL